MRERPILFSEPMVRALLDGRKTQTRRLVKPQPLSKTDGVRADRYNRSEEWAFWLPDNRMTEPRTWTCPHGAVGDRLWVRESFGIDHDDALALEQDTHVCYQADGPAKSFYREFQRYRPSIHMPRWASRLTLELTEVRVERLQEISEADAKTEGLAVLTKDRGQTWKWGIADRDGLPGNDNTGWHWSDWDVDPRKAFAKLWRCINGPGAWDANPWVWALSFKRVEAAS